MDKVSKTLKVMCTCVFVQYPVPRDPKIKKWNMKISDSENLQIDTVIWKMKMIMEWNS